jgi:O-antigen ligase
MVKHVSRIVLYILVFLTPFIYVKNTNELFEFPKMYLVYFLGSALVVLNLISILTGKIGVPKKISLVGLFVCSFILSTAFSVNLYTSVWGYFSRFNGGLISVLIFFGIYSATRRNRPTSSQILRIVALTLFPISVYAILQHFGLGGTWESDTATRTFSTFGQPNWYAAYCAMVLPIILYHGLEEKRSLLTKIGWFSLFILGFCGFWYSYSMSGILGLAVSLVILLVFNFDSAKKNLSTLVVAALFCLTFAFLSPGIFKQKVSDAFVDGEKLIQSFVKKSANVTGQTTAVIPSGKDVSVAVQYEVTDSGFIRKGIWKGALNLALSSPKVFLVGTGPETFPYEFQRFRPASLNYSSEWNYILNKPHNYYLELLTQNGLIGLLLYLAIVIKVLLAKHRIFTPVLLGLFVTNIFSWPTVSASLLFWVFLALLSVDESGEGGRSSQDAPTKVFRARLIISIVLTAACILLNVQFAKQYLADLANKKSQKYFDQGEVLKALDYADQSIKLNTYEPFYYRTRAKTYILQTAGQDTDVTNSFKALAIKDMLKARELNPRNLATLRGLVPLYYFLSLKDISSAKSDVSTSVEPDSFYLGMTEHYYKSLLTAYPYDAGVAALVAKYQKMLGFTVDYGDTVARIRTLRPDLLDWYLK